MSATTAKTWTLGGSGRIDCREHRRAGGSGLILGLCALSFFACCERASAPTGSAELDGPDLLAELPERRAEAGLAGFRSRSQVRFASLPDDPHTLVATFVFPQRAHLRLEREGARPGERRLQFFCGAHAFTIPAGQGSSTELTSEARDLDRLRVELRRVGTSWPAGLDWEPAGDTRRAALEGLGTLHASAFDARGRPGKLAAHTPDGRELERLESIRWPADGRWPSSWRLATERGPIWDETILEVSRGIALLDRYFLPPDRAPSPARDSWDRAAVQPIVLPERVGRRLALPPALGWPAVRDWVAARVREERARLGADARVEDEPAVELDRAGRPVAVWLRAGGTLEKLPKGWIRLPGSGARALWLDRPERVDRLLLSELGMAAAGTDAGSAPFVWLRAAGDGDDGQLVVPLGGS